MEGDYKKMKKIKMRATLVSVLVGLMPGSAVRSSVRSNSFLRVPTEGTWSLSDSWAHLTTAGPLRSSAAVVCARNRHTCNLVTCGRPLLVRYWYTLNSLAQRTSVVFNLPTWASVF